MGYKRKTLHLTFPDKPDLDIYVRSLSVKKALRVMRLASEMTGAASGDVSEDEAMKMAEELFGAFADRVVSWSLEEDDGSPVPVSLDSLLEWDFDEALPWVLAWVQQATSVSVPTAAPVNGTGTSLEASIPMASVSGTS